MLQARTDRHSRIARVLGLSLLLCFAAAGIGCGGAISSSNHQQNGDPLHLGGSPGPLGSPTPQTIEVRLGSEPNKRIVSLSLAMSSLKLLNSGSSQIDLLTDPVTFEFTNAAIATQPVFLGPIYQDTYSEVIFPAMTGQVVFYDNSGNLQTQALSVSGQSVPLTSNLVLGASSPQVLNISLDLTNSFTVANSVTVNALSIASTNSAPTPSGNQPETGTSSFLVGTVTAVNTSTRVITLQPTQGNALAVSYSITGATTFVNCSPSMLTGTMIETESTTQTDGTILASRVALIDHSGSSSELYGTLGGLAPDGFNYNLVADGGAGVNFSTGLLGQNITVDWLASSYSVNTTHLGLNLSADANQDLVFDETHAFPGQFVQLSGNSLVVPDPDSANAGFIQPSMMELEEQTLTGTVTGYTYNSGTQTGTFTLNVASDSAIMRLNSGLLGITVQLLPQTYYRNSPTFANGDTVNVRGLLFAGSQYSNVNYQPPTSRVAFTMVADRVSP